MCGSASSPFFLPRGASSSHQSGQQLCRDWNSQKRCVLKQRDCPNGADHRCNYLVNGVLCGKWNHNAITHHRWDQQESKGGGKGGGKQGSRKRKSFR